MSVFGAPKFTGGTPMEVEMEYLQRTMQWLAIRKEAGLNRDAFGMFGISGRTAVF